MYVRGGGEKGKYCFSNFSEQFHLLNTLVLHSTSLLLQNGGSVITLRRKVSRFDFRSLFISAVSICSENLFGNFVLPRTENFWKLRCTICRGENWQSSSTKCQRSFDIRMPACPNYPLCSEWWGEARTTSTTFTTTSLTLPPEITSSPRTAKQRIILRKSIIKK